MRKRFFLEFVVLLFVLLPLAACRLELAENVTAVSCPDAAADQQSLSLPEHGYCLLLPADYKMEQPTEFETVYFVDSLMDVAHPKLFITVEETGLRTADLAAEALLADFPSDFGIESVDGVTIGSETAVRLDNVPGQDIGRVLFVEHDGRLYQLTFVPASPDAGEVYAQTEALYELVVESFRFMP